MFNFWNVVKTFFDHYTAIMTARAQADACNLRNAKVGQLAWSMMTQQRRQAWQKAQE